MVVRVFNPSTWAAKAGESCEFQAGEATQWGTAPHKNLKKRVTKENMSNIMENELTKPSLILKPSLWNGSKILARHREQAF